MNTLYLKSSPTFPDEGEIGRAAEIIRRGGLVVFPTETVYGLGANAFDEEAVHKIYAAKGRPSDNPLIAHVADMGDLERLVREVPQSAEKLMGAFWGGPLTLIMKKRHDVPDAVTAGLDTVAVRMPSHSVANTLIKLSKTPIAAPSANLSGSPSPTAFSHCKKDMDGRVDAIIDGGDCDIGLESTVLDLSGDVPTILRPGAVTREDVENIAGSCVYGGEYADAPKCPGMKYTHYSPEADVFAVGDMELFLKENAGLENAALIAYDKYKDKFHGAHFYGAGVSEAEYAARLFFLLRHADEEGVIRVYAQLPENRGIGVAIRNRLLKSAGGKVI